MFSAIPAYAGTVSFSGNSTPAAFTLSDEGVNFTFSDPTGGSPFTIEGGSFLFGVDFIDRNPAITRFKLAVSQNVVLNGYSLDSNTTVNGGTFDIELVGGSLLVDDADGSSNNSLTQLFSTVSTDPLQLLAGETYLFSYLFASGGKSVTVL